MRKKNLFAALWFCFAGLSVHQACAEDVLAPVVSSASYVSYLK